MKWSENLFCQEVDTGIFPIQSWTDFKQQFQSQFFLVNAKADAINTLEGSSYYQENWTVDDYLDSFLILASDAGYIDPWTLVVKFRHGDGDQREFDLETRVITNRNIIIPEMFHSCALNK